MNHLQPLIGGELCDITPHVAFAYLTYVQCLTHTHYRGVCVMDCFSLVCVCLRAGVCASHWSLVSGEHRLLPLHAGSVLPGQRGGAEGGSPALHL